MLNHWGFLSAVGLIPVVDWFVAPPMLFVLLAGLIIRRRNMLHCNVEVLYDYADELNEAADRNLQRQPKQIIPRIWGSAPWCPRKKEC